MYFRAGRLEESGACDSARACYARAKDMDLLRFRAPSSFNEIIHRIGKQESVPVAGLQARFELASPCGLIGDALMADHLHPNIEGEFLMSKTFFEAMVIAGWLPARQAGTDEAAFRARWGYTDLDSLFGVYSVRTLKGGWPYRKEKSEENGEDRDKPATRVEVLAAQAERYDNFSLTKAHRELAETYDRQGLTEAAFREYRALVCINRLNEDYAIQAARALLAMRQWEDMVPYLRRSLRIRESAAAHALLGQSYIHTNRDREAVEHLERSIALESGRGQLPVYKYLIEASTRLGENRRARLWTEKLKQLDPRMAEQVLSHGVEVYSGIRSSEVVSLLSEAQKYIVARQFDRAMPLLAKSLQIEETPLANWWIGKIYLMAQKPDLAVRHMVRARTGFGNDEKLLYDLTVAYLYNNQPQEAGATLSALEKVNPGFRDPMGVRQKIGKK
jgi:tetratricopeptide (TPR) repeat protein